MVSGDLEFGSKSITFQGQLRTHIPVNLVPPKKCKEENPARSKSSSKTKKSSNKRARPLPPPPTPLLPPPPPPPSLSFSTTPTPTPLPRRSASASPPSYMEVEVKLRLPDSESHTRLKSILSPFLLKTLQQQNLFFDTTNSALSSQRSVLRLRFLDGDSRCILSLKCRPVLINGVSRVEEDEEELQPSIGRECVDDPTRMGVIQSRILKRVKEEFDVGREDGFVGLGGFENVRDVYEWKGLTLEVDETKYDFGTCHELECETSDPESVKKLLEEFLKENGIRYSYSQMSKFAVFRSQRLPQ